MRVLVLGAGAIGGYFGGRLASSGVDVTFLVRERRRQQLQERGLRLESVHGDAIVEKPQLIAAGEEAGDFEVILLSNKAYHLDDSIESISPYVGEQTVIIPLLNGFAHMEALWERFGKERVMGGLCYIESTLNAQGDIVQTSKNHDAVFGEWEGGESERTLRIQEAFSGINGKFRASHNIQREVWHKYLLITTLSGVTTLLNSPVGPISSTPSGLELTRQLAEEVALVMRSLNAPLDGDIVNKQMELFQKTHASMKSSMLRDMEKGLLVEADHLQGYLLHRARELQLSTTMLQVVYTNLKVYEQKREEAK